MAGENQQKTLKKEVEREREEIDKERRGLLTRIEELETRLRARDKIGLNYLTRQVQDLLLSAAQKADLTDAGNCSVHKHDDKYLNKENAEAFTPDADHEPATKKYVDDQMGPPAYVVGDKLEAYADAEQDVIITFPPSRLKEIEITRPGALRIKFDLEAAGVYWIKGWIYRNGVVVGTERETTSDTPVTYSEDIDGWSVGDLVQLYCQAEGAYMDQHTRNFRIYVDNPIVARVIVD